MNVLDRLTKVAEAMNMDAVSGDDLVRLFDSFVRVLKQHVSEMENDMLSHKNTMRKDVDAAIKDAKVLVKELKKLDINVRNAFDGRSKTLEARYLYEIRKIEALIDSIPTYDDLAVRIGHLEKDTTPEKERDKLESLKGDDRLDKSAIKGLDEELERIAGLHSGGGTTSVIAYTRGQMKLYDLTSQLNGVKKTFALPAFWMITSVQSSSFPNAFRPLIDYTVDYTAMTITFTSEISAAATLATGQTLLVQYAEI